MAKTSMIMREKRREKLVKQHAAKRAQLKEAIRSPKSTDAEREEAQRKLQCHAARLQSPRGCAIAARSPAAPAASTVSSASGARSCAKPRCAATSRASQGQLVSRVLE